MKTNARIFYVITSFFFIAAIVYWFWAKDPTGTTALAFSVALGFLIGYYLDFTSRRIPLQPEDAPEARSQTGPANSGSSARTVPGRSPWPPARRS
jgi:hypothetical protein